MKVLGFRCSPTEVRYAILEEDNGTITFTNHSVENRLIFPKTATNPEDKIKWLYDEIDRIQRTHGPFDKMAVKVNENIQTRYSKVKTTAYLDGIILFYAKRHSIPVGSVVYGETPTNNKKVCDYIEAKIGKTSKYWNDKIADAALAGLQNI